MQNNNPNQAHPSIEEQVFILQEQARKSQEVQEQLLAQQNNNQNLLAQLCSLVQNLQAKTETEAAQAAQNIQANSPNTEPQNNPAFLRSAIKIKSPEKWSGPSDKLSIISWASSVRNYLKHYNLLETAEGATVVQSLLKGDAITYFVHQTETMKHEFGTANELLDHLTSWANPKYTQRNVRERIRSLRQQRNQPVFENITAFQQLMFIVKDMSLPDQLMNYSEGLLPGIKKEVACLLYTSDAADE